MITVFQFINNAWIYFVLAYKYLKPAMEIVAIVSQENLDNDHKKAMAIALLKEKINSPFPFLREEVFDGILGAIVEQAWNFIRQKLEKETNG